VANSASARYAQWVNLHEGLQPDAVTHANRGVAGIDGCTSTALGWHVGRIPPTGTHPHALPTPTWMITGDVAFHYDANAFLTDPSLTAEGLKIVVMNNGGGGIFRWLPGTQHRDVFERHFETPPVRSVEAAARAARATYLCAKNAVDMELALEQLRDTPGLAFLEVITPNVESGDEAKRHLQRCLEVLTF
jgi:2-succinyl-5-enolpyruvyl-6-hydroxy-3-cyclohexene-1-carboxylate synthase